MLSKIVEEADWLKFRAHSASKVLNSSEEEYVKLLRWIASKIVGPYSNLTPRHRRATNLANNSNRIRKQPRL